MPKIKEEKQQSMTLQTNVLKRTSEDQELVMNNQIIPNGKSMKHQGPPIIESFEKELAELFISFKSEDSVYLIMVKRHPSVEWDKNQIK